MSRYDENIAAAQDPNVRRYLDMLAQAEGADYDTLFGGAKFNSYADHPRVRKGFTQTDGKKNTSSAAGRYQFLEKTWDDVAGTLGLKDFSPASQDAAAVELLRRSGSLADVQAGRYDAAVAKDNKTWASLPGSPYAQKTRSQEFVAQALGRPLAGPQEGPQAAPGEAVDWPRLPTLSRADKTAQAAGIVAAAQAGFSAQQGTPEMSEAATDAREQALVREQALRNQTGFTDVFQASRRDPRAQALFTLLDAVSAEQEVVPDGWSYVDNRGTIEAGRTDEEVAYLRENVRGPDSLARATAQLDYRRELDRTYQLAGPVASFFGQMAGGLMDPVGFAAGLGAGKILQLGGVGSRALMLQGRGGAAAGSLLAEGALGNVALEGIQDALGEVKTSSDYAMAAGLGVLFTAPFVRGAYAGAAHAEVERMAQELKNRATQEQIAKVLTTYDRTGLQGTALAREVERAEAEEIGRFVNDGQHPDRIRTPVVPEDVVAMQRKEFDGGLPELAPAPPPPPAPPAAEGAPPPPPPIPPIAPVAPEKMPPVDPELHRVGEVDIPTRTAGSVRMSWARRDTAAETRDGSWFTVRETLDGIVDLDEAPRGVRELASYLGKVLSDQVQDVAIRFRTPHMVDPATGREVPKTVNGAPVLGRYRPGTQTIDVTSPINEVFSPADHLTQMDPRHLETVVHEITHAATASKVQAYLDGQLPDTTDAFLAVKDLDELFGRFKEQVAGRGNDRLSYASSSLHEFAAMAMTSPEVRSVLRAMDGKPLAGRPTTAWDTFVKAVARALGFGKGDALYEASAILDRIISADGSFLAYQGGEPALYAPAINSGAGTRKYAQQMYQHATHWVAANPIDPRKLRVLTNVAKKVGGLSDGLVLAQSKNPIAQMVAGLVTETTTGAAGRGPTAAIRVTMLHNKIVGNGMLGYVNSYKTWGKSHGATVWDDVMHGEKRREFDSAVYAEILERRNPSYAPTADPAVREAADALEALFERSRMAQLEAGTLGSDNLPTTSRGYVPQALDGAKLQALTGQELAAVQATLSGQFQQRLGWDKAFADTFAPYYLDRVRKRAQGSKEIDALGAGGNSIQVIRDTLDAMAVDPTMRDRLTAAQQARAGLRNTKKRLDIDLTAEFIPGRQLMEVYVTDPLTLARSQARQVAGTVALTEQGVLGIRGVRELRSAMEQPGPDGTRVTLQELEAYDRVMAEMLGTPVAGVNVSAGASNLQLLVGLQRLGGLAFTQAAEMFNMIHMLGVRATFAGIPALARLAGEVGRVKKGGKAGNPLLDSLETYGGEIGMSNYKMAAPLDPPEGRLEDYMKSSGIITRLLRGGVHAQSKLSLMRGIMAIQHRHAAEQIVLKALRFVNEGRESKALADMGFTPDLVRELKADLGQIAVFDSAGRVQSLDLTKVTDARTAEAFTQAVHRGVSQIIQGTYIGERSKWMHDDYMRLFLQLRTFGLTATEKQLQRTAYSQGYHVMAGALLAQTALALPLHMARVHAAAAGRDDRDEYLKNNLHPAALARAVMNYSSITGLTGDVLETLGSVAGGWMGTDQQELLGVRNAQMATSVGRLIPAAGTVDSALKALSGKSDVHTAIKQLPFSNLPYLLPLINLTKDED